MRRVDTTSVLELVHSIRRFAGVDKAVFYSVLSRALTAAGSLVTIPLILTRLTSVEQGFYYTFGSIVALQVFLEIGFGAVAVQMIAHEAAHLKVDLLSGVSGPSVHLGRFSANIRFIRKWYAVLALLVGAFLFPVGFWFFSSSYNDITVRWLGPWSLLVFATVGGVFVNSLGAIVEGMGFVSDAVRVRLLGGITQIVLTILGLLVGLKLYSVPLASTAAFIINFYFVWRLLRNVVRETSVYGQEIHVDWFRDIFPFHWRIALSWVSGWFISSAMLPVVFRQLGPAEAGRFGLAMSIAGFINTLAINWTSTKSARWGQMASRKEWSAMDDLFWKVMPQSVAIAMSCSVGAFIFIPHLADWMPRFSGRLPESSVLALLCFVTVLSQITYAEAFYLRAHKREPFLINSVIGGALMAIMLFGFSYSSTKTISALYAVIMLVVGPIWGSIVFSYCRSRWHHATISPKEEAYGC